MIAFPAVKLSLTFVPTIDLLARIWLPEIRRCRALALPPASFPRHYTPSSRDLPSAFSSDVKKYSDDTEEEEEEEEEEDELDDDEGEAAEEYEVVSMDVSEDEDDGREGDVAWRGVGVFLHEEESMRQRAERLIAEVREFGTGIIDYSELAGVYDFPIDKFQRLAIQAFLRGSSIVVSAPTSSGKTLIAEAAALATLAKGRRLFYTTPLKALSNQKFRDFRRIFGDNKVGLLTGDSSINKDAQILIMTTEILRNMLYQSVGLIRSDSRLFHVDAIVLDEVHYLSDISRGTVWEEIVIYCPKEVQLICLSATVANPDELAGWIEQIHSKTELVISSKRPVPLTWHFSMRSSLLPLFDEKGKKMNKKLSVRYLPLTFPELAPSNDMRMRRKHRSKNENGVSSISRQTPLSKNDINSIRRSQVPQIRDTLRQLRTKEMLPAIWFIFNRRSCDAAVQYLEDYNLLDECEAGEVELEIRRFRAQYPDALREVAVRGLLHGIASHHAGCLPLWKSFVEELFQRGLVKVVFATETLAAGINMPARTTVIASLSRRSQMGKSFLSPNELLQMAGRAGRRGIDEVGHVVLLQTPYEGAEESYELLSAALEPLVSQFSASYGMVLNLLAGSKITRSLRGHEENTSSGSGRTLEEARKLVERSFGNYVGSNVMNAAKEELSKIEQEMDILSLEVTDEAIDLKCQEQLSESEYSEISSLQEELRAQKRLRSELRREMECKRMESWKPFLEDFGSAHLPFICLQYKDNETVQHTVPAVYIGRLGSSLDPKIMDMISSDQISHRIFEVLRDSTTKEDIKPAFYIALGSDNSWYLFTEKWVKAIYTTGLPNISASSDDFEPRRTLLKLLINEESKWEKLSDSEFGSIWCMEGSVETWSWSLNVPVLSSLSEEDEVRNWSEEYQSSVERYKEQRSRVSRLKKRITSTEGFKEFKKIIDFVNFTKEKIKRLEARSNRLRKRIEQIEPSGWKEFVKISKVIQETRALDINTHILYPLGETAAAIRGENELWLAMVLRNKALLDIKPSQLAAVCGSLVSEGIKLRPWKSSSYVYEPSVAVMGILDLLEEQRRSLLQIQETNGVQIPCELDSQFCGMVEAWASGLSWREMMMDCGMDEGDLARLLRRTIDLLAQIPKLPDIDPILQKNAVLASNVMDRTPINELLG